MKSEQRKTLLKIAAGAFAGLWLLDLAVIEPAIARWHDQSERITALREKVQRGQQLLDRENSIRSRWAEMVRANLPKDVSVAESDAFKAIGRWVTNSRIILANLTPQWQEHDEDGYDTFECSITANGDQLSLGRFIYEMETDPMPVNFEGCEITTRDSRRTQLSMTAHFTFLRIGEANKLNTGARR